jgi:PAS domain S-box-containing protein
LHRKAIIRIVRIGHICLCGNREIALQAGVNHGTVYNLHAERFVQHTEKMFHQVLENLPAGAYTCDAGGLITYFNPHAQKLWGRAPKLNDAADRYCGSFKLFSTEGMPLKHSECWMALALQNGRGYNGEEIVVEHPDGRRLSVLAHANPFHDETGNLLGAVNVLVDISERTRSERELKEADRNKNEFLATLAHELRNPLAPLRNAVEFLQLKNPPSPDVKWAFDVIDRQMRQMTRLVDDLLDIARITNNRLELRKERVDLVSVLRTAIETAKPLIEASDLKFVVSLPPKPVGLQVDPIRVAQVIANLLNNAAKYSQPGGTVWLIAEARNSEAEIVVRDDGIGIDAPALARVFSMFAQADHKCDGLGIGLALARRLTEMHGGTISVHSDGLGKGAEFTLRLPLAAAPAADSEPKPETATAPAGTRLRILVVDDNRDTADSLQMLLHAMGNEIRTAYDGVEAVRCAEAFEPDIVFLDIGLPKMSGYEVAQALRKQQGDRKLTLVAISGWGQEADRMRSREAGFDRHLVKPVDPAAIFELLRTLQTDGDAG